MGDPDFIVWVVGYFVLFWTVVIFKVNYERLRDEERDEERRRWEANKRIRRDRWKNQ